MFSYYGSKAKIVDLYPAPKFSRIIEPFAGSARYALKYWDRDVLLIDKNETIIRIWKYLQTCQKSDIEKLPNLPIGTKIDRKDFDCIEQAWLMGFLVQVGVGAPRLTVSKFGAPNIQRQKKFIIQNLDHIRHWQIEHADYTSIPNQSATWFIDPPYQFGGEWYRIGNAQLDYAELSNYCQTRQGQVIVCENTKATWMNFTPIGKLRSLTGAHNMEAIWCNDVQQLAMIMP